MTENQRKTDIRAAKKIYYLNPIAISYAYVMLSAVNDMSYSFVKRTSVNQRNQILNQKKSNSISA